MALKHLKELLKEDQEPFQLKDYIADRQCLLKKQAPKTEIQPKKPKPMSKNTSIFCKNACFFSLQDSPDIRKSPLFDFTNASPAYKKSPNRVFLNVPAKTASLLLEAAMRIQKQSKPKSQLKNSSLGLFGSMLKRLTLRNRTHKIKTSEVVGDNVKTVDVAEEKVASVSSSSCSSSCSYNERSSSIDFESSISGRSFEDDDEEVDEFEFTNVLRESNGDYGALCLSPLSPFRFALHKSASSPAKSPARHKFEQDDRKYEQENPVNYLVEEDEDDKEQNSPVSVLDPPFEDDYDVLEEDGYDQECSYAFVQRTKQQLLHKLHRFEKLAELDPIELEKRMIEEEDNDKELMLEQPDQYDKYDYESFTFDEQRQVHGLLEDVIRLSGFQDIKRPGIKRLITDLILEEECAENSLHNDEQLIKRVCKRLELCKEVECNTIDMMVEMDFRREIGDWKKPQKEIGEAATDFEAAIFAVLVDEFVQDLASSA